MKTAKVNKTTKTTGINEMKNVVTDVPEQPDPEVTATYSNHTEFLDESTFGVVNCNYLNVREAPDPEADVLTVVEKGAEILIDFDVSTDDFYSVCTETGVEGYCMKQFIEV